MNIFKKIQASVYNIGFYEEIRNQSVGSAIKYFLKLALLLALAGLIVSTFTIVPKVKNSLQDFKSDVLSHYPQDLEVKFAKGVVSTNMPEPYVLALPNSIKMSESGNAPEVSNALVINTKIDHAISFDEFRQMKTFFFLGKNYALHYDKNDRIVYQDLSRMPDFTATKALLEKMLGFVDYFVYIIPVLCFIGVFFFVMMQLIWVLLIALIFFIVQKIAGRGLPYASSYKSCVYASTLPIIAGLIALLFTIPDKFFILDIITIVIAFINTAKAVQQA